MNRYSAALNAGNTLSPAEFHAVAEKLHEYTGVSAAFIEKLNLRMSIGEFRHELLGDQGMNIGELDSRFTGPQMDPLSLNAEYDPQSAAISAAYVAGFNQYAHNVLNYGRNQTYRPEAYDIVTGWNRDDTDLVTHRGRSNPGLDLAEAMKFNPKLRVEVDAGYYDLNLPYYGMVYSVNHLPLPKDLQSHIQFKFYGAGHMIYVNVPALKELHDNTAAFIHSTSGPQ